MVEFEWDENKRLSNIAKHGIDFRDAQLLFDGCPTVTTTGIRGDEQRNITTGIYGDRFYTVVWTHRNNRIRLISYRRARGEEERIYRELYG